MYSEPYTKVVHLCITTLTKTCSHPRLAGCSSETHISDAKPEKLIYLLLVVKCDNASSETSVYMQSHSNVVKVKTTSYIYVCVCMYVKRFF